MKFRYIDYPNMLLQTLRAYFSVNSQGKVNNFYTYLACIIQPLIAPFNTYAAQRITDGLIANCYWQIGQLTNVLNYLYDNVNNSIFITQSFPNPVSATTFGTPAIINAGTFGNDPVWLREFNDIGDSSPVIFNVPNYVNLSQITATIALIALQGIYYEINIFIPPIS